MGIAILGSIGTAVYRLNISGAIPGMVTAADATTIRSTLGGALAVADKLPKETSQSLINEAQKAFTTSLEVMALISAILSVLLALLVILKFKESTTSPVTR